MMNRTIYKQGAERYALTGEHGRRGDVDHILVLEREAVGGADSRFAPQRVVIRSNQVELGGFEKVEPIAFAS